MANFFKPVVTYNLVETFPALAFTTSIIAPPAVYAEGVNLNLNEINFGIKVEKI